LNSVHRAILDHVRANSIDDELLSLTDQQLLFRMFFNQRGTQGMRLSRFGLVVMQNFFRGFDIATPKDEYLAPKHLVALEQHVTMPYYFDKEHIVLFDSELAVKLRLIGGRLSTLMEIETS
jgi:hypothetical protein